VTLTVSDLFCGAGGSSLGAQTAGVDVALAMNHWPVAVELHNMRFPNARHDCADISQADPRRYPRTNILLASPECTNHSQARGVSRKRQDPSLFDSPDLGAERSRATMWDVVRFTEQMRYDAVVVENVIEVTNWMPWHAWWMAMESLGYVGRILSINSMDHGVPQSRDRIYVVWLPKGVTIDLDLERTAWCAKCHAPRAVRQVFKNGRRVGRYRTQWVWACMECGAVCTPTTQPAASIIDWDLICPRIGDRTRPLAAATRSRILAGLQRYGWAPITTSGAGNTYETTPGNRAKSIDEPLPVQQTTATSALATPPGFLYQTAHGGRVNDVTEPHPTVCASDDRLSLVVPLRRNGEAHTTDEVTPTVTAGGNHHALVVTNNPNNVARPVDDPLPTATTSHNRHGLLMRNNSGAAEMVTPLDEPTRTMTTKGHQSLLVPYNGKGQAMPDDRPLGTQTTRDHWSLLLPNHAHQPARPITLPTPALTTTATVGLVDLDVFVDDCGFRMLEPYEVAAAMAFPTGYIPRTLPKKDQVKLAGNAVTPPVMAWIVQRVAAALEAAA
jgi:DNA (cytosine-5)-methyltransferase 1